MGANRKSVLVVGAGLSGLAAGAKLKEAGFDDFVIVERAESVGGTWRDNAYPGISCDVPAALYAFSFAPNPDWSHRYARGREIYDYTKDLVSRFDLSDHLRLGDGVASAIWEPETSQWLVTTDGGIEYRVDAVITALGQLSDPNYPDIPGLSRFAGPALHSARWDPETDLAGKRVGVIGSAASAIQIIPEVATVAAQVHVFQRTPNWLIPRGDYPILPEMKTLIKTSPEVAKILRQAAYEESEILTWQAVSWTEAGRAAIDAVARAHLAYQVPDPELRARLTPDYPVLCRRILISDDFYPALLRDNVNLVTDKIANITAHSVVMEDQTAYECDVLVYATGFKATAWNWSVDLVGREGRHLREAWIDGAEGYYGVAVSGFPNLFTISGPNSGLGHTAQTILIEMQIDYILRILKAMQDKDIASVDVSPEAQRRFNEKLQARLAKTAWADPSCTSWYKMTDGRITQNWGWNTRSYAEMTKEIEFDDFLVEANIGA